MDRHSRKQAKQLAKETRRAQARFLDYSRHNHVKNHTYELVGILKLRYRHPDESVWTDLGTVSRAIVTDAAIAVLIDVLEGGSSSTLQNFKYHDTGTGSTAESAADTTMETSVSEGRDVGTQVNPSAGVYRSIATHTYFAGAAITEHGIFSAEVGGTLLDRSVFTAINVVTGTQVEYTYDLTLTGS
jgi:hypothetical protein